MIQFESITVKCTHDKYSWKLFSKIQTPDANLHATKLKHKILQLANIHPININYLLFFHFTSGLYH